MSKAVGTLTLEEKNTVVAARETYEALSAEAKAKVSVETLEKLAAAEKEIVDIETSDATGVAIRALPAISEDAHFFIASISAEI